MGKKPAAGDETGGGGGCSAAKALRHMVEAEEKYRNSDFKSALKHAKKALRIDESLPGVAALVAGLRVLRAPPSDHYTALRLHPFSPCSSVKAQFRYLSLLLRSPDQSCSSPSKTPTFPSSVADAALKRISDAFAVLSDRTTKKEYDLKLENEKPQPVDTFWTTCATCQLFHEFDRRYLGQKLLCPSCRKRFVAVEVEVEADADGEKGEDIGCPKALRSRTRVPATKCPPEKNGSRKRPRALGSCSMQRLRGENEKEPTLAEWQMEAMKLKSKGHFLSKSKEDEEGRKKTTSSQELVVALKEEAAEDSGMMAVEDSDFYDFDKDRVEKSFRKGQVWAVYDDDDGMPRNYGLVGDVLSMKPFRLKLGWLDFMGNGRVSSPTVELHIPCGTYKLGERQRKVDADSINIFSHPVDCERAAREQYRIYPRKGSVWALYGEGALGGKERRHYDIVVCLTSYSEAYGLSMAYLDKVDGFKTVFSRREVGLHAVKWVEKDELGMLSHQIPARKLSGSEGVDFPGECWELDPASLPAELLCITQGK